MKTYDIIETGVNIVGVSVSLIDIQNILSIVLLCVSIGSLLFRGGLTIYKHIKNKEIDKAIEVATELDDEIERRRKDGNK